MTNVLQQVQETISVHGLIDRGDRVVAGFSGGPDSICLLHVLKCLSPSYGLELHVAHLNHGARGQAADADAAFAERTAGAWDLPVTVMKRDVPRLADDHGLAFEEAARRVRYAFLAEVADEVGAAKIAVGHNADDQAETVLMHLLRGSGLAGLRGMLPLTAIDAYRLLEPLMDTGKDGAQHGARGGRRLSVGTGNPPVPGWRATGLAEGPLSIIRPLLEVPRADIERYCLENNLEPRFDRSNLDTTYFRNRLRRELMPVLETYNPNIRERLCHMATVLAAEYDLLVRGRQEAWPRVVREAREDAVVFERAAWQELPVALQRSTLREAAFRLRRTLRDVTFVHVEHARRIALDGETGQQATLPMGLALRVGYDTLTMGEAGTAGLPPDEPLLWSDRPLTIPVPGIVPLPESDWHLEIGVLESWDLGKVVAPDHPWTAYLDADSLAQPVLLRTRRAGDRLRPHGMNGHTVKLSDLMVNLKIPEVWRDHVPVLVAGEDVVWLCGYRIAHGVVVGPHAQRVARFRFRRAPSLPEAGPTL
jgi:tRNA(Ile)-lysidine synthase